MKRSYLRFAILLIALNLLLLASVQVATAADLGTVASNAVVGHPGDSVTFRWTINDGAGDAHTCNIVVVTRRGNGASRELFQIPFDAQSSNTQLTFTTTIGGAYLPLRKGSYEWYVILPDEQSAYDIATNSITVLRPGRIK